MDQLKAAKVGDIIDSGDDYQELHQDLVQLSRLAEKWQNEFNSDKGEMLQFLS